MDKKRIYIDKVSQNEKELLELFRELESNECQWRFLGYAEYHVEQLKERDKAYKAKQSKNLFKLIK